jgi:C4-dicarboxylate-specific signal transduction histidine kinase
LERVGEIRADMTIELEALRRRVAELESLETEQRRAEEQMLITDRLASIGELASGLAHELNNPLTGVIGFLPAAFGQRPPR